VFGWPAHLLKLVAMVQLLLEDLALSHADGSFHKRLMQLAKVDLLEVIKRVVNSYF